MISGFSVVEHSADVADDAPARVGKPLGARQTSRGRRATQTSKSHSAASSGDRLADVAAADDQQRDPRRRRQQGEAVDDARAAGFVPRRRQFDRRTESGQQVDCSSSSRYRLPPAAGLVPAKATTSVQPAPDSTSCFQLPEIIRGSPASADRRGSSSARRRSGHRPSRNRRRG